MLERVDVEALLEIIDDQRVRTALPGYDREGRFRALGKCVWLREAERIAVIEPQWAGKYRAIILDVDDEESEEFIWGCLAFLFNEIEIEELHFMSRSGMVGERFSGAFRLGSVQASATAAHAWRLSRADWAAATTGRLPAAVALDRREAGR